MPRHRRPGFLLTLLTGLAAVGLATPPLPADWLVPIEGELIETRGPWSVDGDELTFTDVDGEAKRLALAAVDLEASEEATALRAPRITLYMTSWCGFCRRTSNLLKSMKVAYVEKDIENDAAAREEYKAKGDGYRGIPLLDIDGQIVKGFKATLIHQLAFAVKQEQEAAIAAAEAASEAGD